MSRPPTPQLATLTVSARSEITVPDEVLDATNAQPGDQLRLTTRGETVIIRRGGPSVTQQPAGSLGRYARRRPALLPNEQER